MAFPSAQRPYLIPWRRHWPTRGGALERTSTDTAPELIASLRVIACLDAAQVARVAGKRLGALAAPARPEAPAARLSAAGLIIF